MVWAGKTSDAGLSSLPSRRGLNPHPYEGRERAYWCRPRTWRWTLNVFQVVLVALAIASVFTAGFLALNMLFWLLDGNATGNTLVILVLSAGAAVVVAISSIAMLLITRHVGKCMECE